MAKGRAGFWLEGWKFSIYLLLPLGASWYYSDPVRVRKNVEYWNYISYPPNPNVNMKEQLKELREQQEQRRVYREQLKQLMEKEDGTSQRNGK